MFPVDEDERPRPRERLHMRSWFVADDGRIVPYERYVSTKILGFLCTGKQATRRGRAVQKMCLYVAGAQLVAAETGDTNHPVHVAAVLLLQRVYRRRQRQKAMAIVRRRVLAEDTADDPHNCAFWAAFAPIIATLQNAWYSSLSTGEFADPQFNNRQHAHADPSCWPTIPFVLPAESGWARQWVAKSISEKTAALLTFPCTHMYATQPHEFPPYANVTYCLTENAISLQQPGTAARDVFVAKIRNHLQQRAFTTYYPTYRRCGRHRPTIFEDCVPSGHGLIVPVHAAAAVGAVCVCIATRTRHTITAVYGRVLVLAPAAVTFGAYRTEHVGVGNATYTGGIRQRLKEMLHTELLFE
jgi:hypothetical protein